MQLFTAEQRKEILRYYASNSFLRAAIARCTRPERDPRGFEAKFFKSATTQHEPCLFKPKPLAWQISINLPG